MTIMSFLNITIVLTARGIIMSVIFINICVGLALTALEIQNNIFNIIIIIICIYRRYTVEVSSIIEHIII